MVILLRSNQLSGTICSSIGNLTNLSYLDLSKNKLDGIVPESIGNLINLEYLAINDNQLKSNDISTILSSLVFCEKCSKLQVFSISNNVDIKGDLSKIFTSKDNKQTTVAVQQTSLEYFIASKCDLYGSLPNNIQFTSMLYFVVDSNRLSCSLPNNLISSNENSLITNMTIVLPSNLFRTSQSNTFPNWMDVSMFKSVESFYITGFDQILSMSIALVGSIGITAIVITKCILGIKQYVFILQSRRNKIASATSTRVPNSNTSTPTVLPGDTYTNSSLLRTRKHTFMLLSHGESIHATEVDDLFTGFNQIIFNVV